MSDKERKSWRELDRRRDSSAHRDGEHDERASSSSRESSRAYRSYKSQLDQLWREGSGAGGARRTELRKGLLEASKSRDVIRALATYRQEFGFPREEAVLAKIIELDEDELVLEALEQYDELLEAGDLKRVSSLKVRLKTVKMTSGSTTVVERADALLKRLS